MCIVRATRCWVGGRLELDLVVSAGFTELALQGWLQRHLPGAQIRQISPKGASRGSRTKYQTLRRDGAFVGQGTTGRALDDELVQTAKRHQEWSNLSANLLLVDDADCRFSDATDAVVAMEAWRSSLELRLRAEARDDLRLFVLLASPEIEAWLLADWPSTWGDEGLRRYVEIELGCSVPDGLEAFGAPTRGGGCSRKLSRELQDALARRSPPVDYSKRKHGPDYVRRVRPDRLEAVLPIYFRPAWQRLLRECGTSIPPSTSG